jgi:hypothetical protein
MRNKYYNLTIGGKGSCKLGFCRFIFLPEGEARGVGFLGCEPGVTKGRGA